MNNKSMGMQCLTGSNADRHASSRARGLLLGMAALLLGTATAITSAQPLPAGDSTAVLFRGETGNYEVPVNKSGVIRLAQPARRVSVGNPGIVDVLVLRTQEIYVVGKDIGSTNLTMWDENERVFATFNINVTQDLESLKRSLHELLPDDKVGVQAAQERIVLNGQVSNLSRMDAAMKLAQGFLTDCVKATSTASEQYSAGGKKFEGGDAGAQNCKKGEIINLMQISGTQQVMLEVKVAEVARTLLDRLDGGFNLLRLSSDGLVGITGTGAIAPAGVPSAPSLPGLVPGVIERTGLFGTLVGSKYLLQGVLDVARRNDLAKILAEPTLTTLSGEEAQFLSGGEFPIPVPQGLGNQVTIQFKDFGVGVKFVPVILDSGNINLKLAVSVSDITQANTVTATVGSNTLFVIPSLSKRSASSSVELSDGQTMGIAGLISDNVREFVSKLPLLGDIPILGALFRSQEFRRDETELVIFVTPHLAKPIAPSQVRLPTDQFVPPDSLEFYLLGRTESAKMPKASVRGTSSGGGSAPGSSFGHAQ